MLAWPSANGLIYPQSHIKNGLQYQGQPNLQSVPGKDAIKYKLPVRYLLNCPSSADWSIQILVWHHRLNASKGINEDLWLLYEDKSFEQDQIKLPVWGLYSTCISCSFINNICPIRHATETFLVLIFLDLEERSLFCWSNDGPPQTADIPMCAPPDLSVAFGMLCWRCSWVTGYTLPCVYHLDRDALLPFITPLLSRRW